MKMNWENRKNQNINDLEKLENIIISIINNNVKINLIIIISKFNH